MKVLASVSGTGDTTYTWSGVASANSLSFSNDGSLDAVLLVNGISITVKAGEVLEEISFPVLFTSVDVTTDSSWRLLIGD